METGQLAYVGLSVIATIRQVRAETPKIQKSSSFRHNPFMYLSINGPCVGLKNCHLMAQLLEPRVPL